MRASTASGQLKTPNKIFLLRIRKAHESVSVHGSSRIVLPRFFKRISALPRKIFDHRNRRQTHRTHSKIFY
jgi:hypothetical protein